jgi:hypothetical protein
MLHLDWIYAAIWCLPAPGSQISVYVIFNRDFAFPGIALSASGRVFALQQFGGSSASFFECNREKLAPTAHINTSSDLRCSCTDFRYRDGFKVAPLISANLTTPENAPLSTTCLLTNR